ncbi:MAG: DoxX family protein, partial [Gemmatimonadaceae bacterium]
MRTSPLFASSPRTQAIGLAVVRVITGITFMMHGYQKLFTFGIAGVQGAFTKMGAPLPMVTGPLVAGLEFFGGIALIIGLDRPQNNSIQVHPVNPADKLPSGPYGPSQIGPRQPRQRHHGPTVSPQHKTDPQHHSSSPRSRRVRKGLLPPSS